MKSQRKLILFASTIAMVATIWFITSVQAEEIAGGLKKSWNFEDIPIGQLPAGWKIDATNPKGRLAEWEVVTDPGAPDGKRVFSITRINDTFGGVFNLCWTSDVLFKDGVIEVKVRANSGEEDQGGGVIWRARDENNYYVARYNPLERNFRLYYVKDGARKILGDSAKLATKTGEWFTIKIIHHGDKIEGWLNEKKGFEVTDRTFMGPGGVGFWTKADAATSFDDLNLFLTKGDQL